MSSRTSPGPCNDDLSGASPQTRIHELNESPSTRYSELGVVLLQLHILHYSYVSFMAQASLRVKFLVDSVCTSGCLFSFNIDIIGA